MKNTGFFFHKATWLSRFVRIKNESLFWYEMVEDFTFLLLGIQ